MHLPYCQGHMARPQLRHALVHDVPLGGVCGLCHAQQGAGHHCRGTVCSVRDCARATGKNTIVSEGFKGGTRGVPPYDVRCQSLGQQMLERWAKRG